MREQSDDRIGYSDGGALRMTIFGYFSKAERRARAERRKASQEHPHWREVIVISPPPKPLWRAPKVSEDCINKIHKDQ
jgi:hypothetical protein